MLPALFAFLHHLAAFSIAAVLVLESVLLRGDLTIDSARKLLNADRRYGIAAMAILIVGGLRVAFFEKTPAYYPHSGPFIAKIMLFAAIGLLSIYPTLTFLSWREALAQNRLPAVDAARMQRVRLIVRIELGLLMLLILCAALMAKGVGTF